MKLLIVESPSKAKTINTYLGKDYKVISSFGHVRGLPSVVGSVKPDDNFSMSYEVLDKSKKHVDEIIRSSKQADEIYLATDPDREGEAISWHIVEILKAKKAIPKGTTVKRVVFNEITKNAVIEAVNNPREIDENLVLAQQTRQALDYLVGFTLSPVLWRKLPGNRSAGRVQSVALRVICERENEIEKFISQEYWSITALFENSDAAKFKGHLSHYQNKKLDKFDLNSEKLSLDAVKEIEQHKYHVEKIDKKQMRRFPQPPFTTSTMLQEAGRKLGYSASKTSKMAQNLYEGIDIGGTTTGLITYMRTDSVNVSKDALAETRKFIGKKFGDSYLPKAAREYKTKTKNAQEAHEAIRPTDVTLSPEKIEKYLSDDQYKLYDLIWKRMVASQMENALIDIVSADICSTDKLITFRSTGSTVVFNGYFAVYKEDEDDSEDEESQALPKLSEQEKINLDKLDPKQHFTQPPPRYTEASLVKKMEELGIGRPSTYPSIISILQEREYVKIDKKRFFPESKGRLVTAFLSTFFSKYVEYDFTAKLEDELDDIANAEIKWMKVLKDFWSPFKEKTDEVLKIDNIKIIQEIEKDLSDLLFKKEEGSKTCPTCKTGTLGLKTGKFGAFIGCSNYPECKHVQQFGQTPEGDSEDGEKGKFPIVIGKNSSGDEISIRKGPYGIYIQSGEGKDIKRVSLPKGKSPELVDLDYAAGLLTLPKVIGDHPETGEPIKVGIGRFGPYLQYQGAFRSLKEDDPVSIGLHRAVEILAMPIQKKGFARKSFSKGKKKK
jgi:DNA topoisomerase I